MNNLGHTSKGEMKMNQVMYIAAYIRSDAATQESSSGRRAQTFLHQHLIHQIWCKHNFFAMIPFMSLRVNLSSFTAHECAMI